MKNLKQTLINTILPIISAIAVAGLAYAAWVEPGTNPPGDNVAAPINVSTATQTFQGSKTLSFSNPSLQGLFINGSLGVNQVFRAYSNGIFDGNVGIGTANPLAKLDVTSTNSGFLPPRVTTAQRDAISSKIAGLLIYNSSTNKMEYWNGTQWMPFGAGAVGCSDGTDNDGDGLTDYPSDPGCSSASDPDEYNAPACYCQDTPTDCGFMIDPSGSGCYSNPQIGTRCPCGTTFECTYGTTMCISGSWVP